MAILPLKDENPLDRISFQWITIIIMVACVGIFLWQLSLGEAEGRTILALGTIPSVLFGTRDLPTEISLVSPHITLVTSMFLHGGWMHLIGNMLFLWVFGDNVEDSMGHVRFLIFYLLCGVAGTSAHAVLQPGSTTPLIGASGAISGVLGAYLMLHPKSRLLVLFMNVIPLRLPAGIVLIGWIGLQFISLGSSAPDSGGVAWWAHIGGFVAGMVLIIPFRHRGVPLFDGIGWFHPKDLTPIVVDERRHQRSIFPNTYGAPAPRTRDADD